jgi:hypothetical protein
VFLDKSSVAVDCSAMTYDINTLDELVQMFGGPKAAAEEYDITPQAVCDWKAKGYLPPSRHLQVVLALKRRGKTCNPVLFDCSEEDWRLLGIKPQRVA